MDTSNIMSCSLKCRTFNSECEVCQLQAVWCSGQGKDYQSLRSILLMAEGWKSFWVVYAISEYIERIWKFLETIRNQNPLQSLQEQKWGENRCEKEQEPQVDLRQITIFVLRKFCWNLSFLITDLEIILSNI